jgi:hypothetical protein
MFSLDVAEVGTPRRIFVASALLECKFLPIIKAFLHYTVYCGPLSPPQGGVLDWLSRAGRPTGFATG